MRLTWKGKLVYALMAVLSGTLLARSAVRADWLGTALAAGMFLLAMLPVLRGRDPLGDPRHARRWMVQGEAAEPSASGSARKAP